MAVDALGYASLPAIYDAAMDAERWPEALDGVVAAAGGIAAAIMVVERQHNPYSVQALGGGYRKVPPGEMDHYLKKLSHLESGEWEALARQPPWRLLRDNEVFDSAVLDAREDYRFLREKVGIGRRIGVRLNENAAWYDAMTVAFDAELPAIPAQSVARVQPLLPHIAKSIQMHRAFAELRRRYAAVLSVLDRISVGLAIALTSGEIIVANSEAERIFALDDGLLLSRDRRIVCQTADESAKLQARISEAALTAFGERNLHESLLVAPRPSQAPPFLIEVAPIRDSAGELEPLASGAVITIIDPEKAPMLDVARFARLYGLTEAEASVCAHMIAGLTGTAIAEIRSTSPETVKSQMSAIMAKTGARRRGDLIRLVVRTLPPIT